MAGRPSARPDGSLCGASRAGRGRRRRRTPSCSARRRSGRPPRAAPSRTSGSTVGRPSRLSTTIGVATLYGRFATSLRSGRARRSRGRAPARPECTADVLVPGKGTGQARLERAIELDGVHVADAPGQVARQDTRAPDRSRARRRRIERGEAADHAEDVVVGEEVLAERLLRGDAHGERPEARTRWPRSQSIRPARRAASSPRASARTATVRRTFAGSFGEPRKPLRCEIRAVGLGEQPARVDSRGGEPELLASAGSSRCPRRNVPAVGECRLQQARLGEAMEDHRAVEPRQDRGRLVGGLPQWITTGLPSSSARARCSSKSRRWSVGVAW